MLDLRTDAVTDWLQQLRPADPDSAWPPAIRPVEASARVERLLAEFGDLLEREARENALPLSADLKHPDLAPDLQLIFAQLGAARPLRILHWLNAFGVPDHFVIISTLLSGDTPSARALSAAIAAVTRRATLHRLFAPERLIELQTAAEIALKESM